MIIGKVFEVKREGPGDERKSYGTFEDRDMAERVAIRVIEKHRGTKVTVEPVVGLRK